MPGVECERVLSLVSTQSQKTLCFWYREKKGLPSVHDTYTGAVVGTAETATIKLYDQKEEFPSPMLEKKKKTLIWNSSFREEGPLRPSKTLAILRMVSISPQERHNYPCTSHGIKEVLHATKSVCKPAIENFRALCVLSSG